MTGSAKSGASAIATRIALRSIRATNDRIAISDEHSSHLKGITMNGNRTYGIRVEGAKYGVGVGSALAIPISYTNNPSIRWAIIHCIFGWLYVIYVALFASPSAPASLRVQLQSACR